MNVRLMILTILGFCAFTCVSFSTYQDYDDSLTKFNNYLSKYDKEYVVLNPSEYWQRFNTFVNTDREIAKHNSKSSSWTMGHNRFSDMYQFEQGHYKGYYVPKYLNDNRGETYQYDSTEPLPSAVDWRANGWVTPVKDQGQCGSCWAFSSTGTMEGQHANVTGKLVSLSEQDLVDCVDDCYGCQGGWMNKAMEYVVENGGVDTEQSYPYTGVDNPSCKFNKTSVGATFTKVVNISQGDCHGLLHAVANVGPVSVAVNAMGIMNYATGIYSDKTCDPQELDHGVLVVGYGETTDNRKFWIVKNSWNANWGQDGYIYWDRDINDMCGICQDAAFPVATKTTEVECQ